MPNRIIEMFIGARNERPVDLLVKLLYVFSSGFFLFEDHFCSLLNW